MVEGSGKEIEEEEMDEEPDLPVTVDEPYSQGAVSDLVTSNSFQTVRTLLK